MIVSVTDSIKGSPRTEEMVVYVCSKSGGEMTIVMPPEVIVVTFPGRKVVSTGESATTDSIEISLVMVSPEMLIVVGTDNPVATVLSNWRKVVVTKASEVYVNSG